MSVSWGLQSFLWKYSNCSLNWSLLTKRITRAKIIRHLTPWRSCGFPCVFKVDCNGTCLKQGGQGHILNIKQFIIMKESITVIFSTGEKLSVLRCVRFCILHYIFEGINHTAYVNATRDHFCGATRGISSRKVIFCARSRTCLLKLFIKDFFDTYYKNKIILPLTENRPGAPSNIVSPSFDIAALNPASQTPSLFSK